MLNIKEKIEKLPFLPEIVFELQSLQKQKDFDHKKILTLIEKDSFVSAKILEMANSKLFGFNNSVKTVSKALSLFGATFTIAIAISESIKNSIKINLDIYNIQAKRFFDLSEYSCKIMLNWLDEEDVDLKEKLFLPCLIHEIGKFIISDTVHSNKKEEFIDLCNSVSDISSLERNFVSYSSSEVTSLLLKKWNFDNSICEDIYYIDSLKNKKICLILNVIKTICNINNPLSKTSVLAGIQKAKEFGLNDIKLKQTIESILISSIDKN